MKKVFKVAAVVAFMLTATVSFAIEPILNVVIGQDKVLDMKMNADSNQTHVKIIDANYEIIFYENVDSEDVYSKRFNFKSLENGTYFLSVDDALKETVFTLSIADSDISILKKAENFKPIYIREDDKVFMNFLNLEKEEVKITVFDSDGRTVYEEIVNDENKIEKVFNFSEAYEDTYTIIIKNKNARFYEQVVVK